jgi:serine/threonine protein kinase
LLSQLNRGGFGEVCIAFDTENDNKEVAIKFVNKKKLKRKFLGRGKNLYS